MTKTQKKQMAEKLRSEAAILMGRCARREAGAGLVLLSFAERLYAELIGGFDSFASLLSAWNQHGYRPTIRPDLDPRNAVLADLYDFFQAKRGLDVKAYRG